MGQNSGKNISKNLSGKFCQKLLDHAKKSATDTLKIHDLFDNTFKYKITNFSKSSPQINLEIVESETEHK